MKKFLLAVLVSTQAFALDQTQITTLHDFAAADTTASACITTGDDGCLVNYLNSESAFVVWRTQLNEQEIIENDGFNPSLVDGLTAGKRDEWTNFIFKFGHCNPSRQRIRDAFADVWSGTAAKNAVNAAILELSKRNATVAESALATGTGSNAAPGMLTFEGSVSFQDAVKIRVGQ